MAAAGKVTGISAATSANKGALATCPAGKRLLGPAGRLVNGSGQVVLDGLSPASALTSTSAFGREDDTGFSDDWVTIAEGICATPPPGLQVVSDTSPTNSSSKSVTATCPAGKRVLGTGADTVAGNGQVVLDDIAPNAALTAVTAYGAEDGNGYSGSWSIRAYAVCATAPGGLQRVATTSASNSAGIGKTQSAPCPAGKDLLGVGGALNGGAGQVVLDELNPAADLASVDVHASEDEDGQAASWSLTAYAICANGSQRTTAPLANPPEPGGGLSSECPPNTSATGGGGEITGGFGQVTFDNLTPEDSVPPSFSASAAEDGTGTGAQWSLLAYSICTTPLPGREVVPVTNAGDTSTKTATATCPAGKRVVGTGAGLAGAAGEVLLERIAPNAGLTAVTSKAVEDPDGAGQDWDLTVYAVCANRPAGLVRVTAASGFESGDVNSITATCPAGKTLLGTGHELTGAGGRVALDDLRPNALLTSTQATAIETEFGNPDDWSVTAYAICASA